MIESKVYTDLVPFSITEVGNRPDPTRVLLCSPDHFDIIDEKNVHMAGNIGQTNKELVQQQWNSLKTTYDNLKERSVLDEVSVIPGAVACEDMVFCANQTLPYRKADGQEVVVMSKMRHESRQREVPHFEKFFSDKGFQPLHFKSADLFEGMGDVIPHPQKKLLYGGYGHRTGLEAYQELAIMLDTPIVALELVSPKFYHLDTCFVPLSATSVMLCKSAFSETGFKIIEQLFEKIHLVPEEEAVTYFSLNAHAFIANGHKVAILQKGSTTTLQILKAEGYEVTELDTSEFMKSGGSVFCMKMMY